MSYEFHLRIRIPLKDEARGWKDTNMDLNLMVENGRNFKSKGRIKKNTERKQEES